MKFKQGRKRDSRLHNHIDLIRQAREVEKQTFKQIVKTLETKGLYYAPETVRGFYHLYVKGKS